MQYKAEKFVTLLCCPGCAQNGLCPFPTVHQTAGASSREGKGVFRERQIQQACRRALNRSHVLGCLRGEAHSELEEVSCPRVERDKSIK